MEEIITPQKKSRLIFIDVMRGIAVLWMIETHVVDVVLQSIFKNGTFYDTLNISNGFVAVSFLFCAGAGFWLASMKKAEDYKHFRPPLWAYLRRLGLILAIAYWLYFPAMSFQRMWAMKAENWIFFYDCDVLQTIVYSSFVALIILMLTPKIKYIPWIFLVLTLIIFLTAPFVQAADTMSMMPPFFGALFAKSPISKFPLFPFSGYFFGGVTITAYFMQTENKKKAAWIFTIAGAILVFVLFRTRFITDFYPGYKDWWHCSPFHSLFRISGSVMVFGFLYLIERYYKEKKIGSILQLFGQESLFVYTGHNMLVYGSLANYGMRYFIGQRLEWFGTFMIFAGVSLLFYGFSLSWNSLKAKDIYKARILMASSWALFLIVFFVNPL